jgi:aminomethyltransferase
MSEVTSKDPARPLAGTPLHALHVELGARMVAFAGWQLPLHYPMGVVAEHQHSRGHASLFDVSHMGQAILAGPNAAAELERLTPTDLRDLPQGRSRYTFLLDDEGNILDDLIVTRLSPTARHAERFFLIVNAANKAADFAHLQRNLPDAARTEFSDRALLALQGPRAEAVLAKKFPQTAAMPFMSLIVIEVGDAPWFVSRSGYTGEDGYEISLPAAQATAFARELLADSSVRPAGLGARDTLRLEAGLCLHGHDIDTTTNPVEAALEWAIPKRRRLEGGFPGSDRIRLQLEHGPPRRRVGLAFAGRQPAREGAEIASPAGLPLGHVTSGGFGPTLGHAIAMGYVAADHAQVGANLLVHVRDKALPASVVRLPFVPHRYHSSHPRP